MIITFIYCIGFLQHTFDRTITYDSFNRADTAEPPKTTGKLTHLSHL